MVYPLVLVVVNRVIFLTQKQTDCEAKGMEEWGEAGFSTEGHRVA